VPPENNKRIFERWPRFFVHKDDPLISGMDLGFRCGNGWFQLVWDHCAQLEPLAKELEQDGKTFEILQVKSKFGELRVHVSDWDDAIRAAIGAARKRSIQTCELCGKLGSLAVDETHWRATLCDECRKSGIDIRPYL
jgi:hypothetical protein